jgi:hypothetical protein
LQVARFSRLSSPAAPKASRTARSTPAYPLRWESSAGRWDPIQELLDRESEITAKAKELHYA